jgi:hypothetical protein
MSMRNFEMTSRQDVGRGRFDHPAGSRGANAIQFGAENLFPLPSGSISRIEPTLERGHVSQALLDISALIFLLLFLVSAALSFPLAIFLLLFARI